MGKHLIYCTILSLSAFASLAQAQVKKCVDSEGKVSFTHAVCPSATKSERTVMRYTPASSASPEPAQDWKEANKEFNQRQAQRDQIQATENRNRLAADAFNKAASQPLEPGYRRTITANFGTGETKTVKTPNKD